MRDLHTKVWLEQNIYETQKNTTNHNYICNKPRKCFNNVMNSTAVQLVSIYRVCLVAWEKKTHGHNLISYGQKFFFFFFMSPDGFSSNLSLPGKISVEHYSAHCNILSKYVSKGVIDLKVSPP